MATEVIDTFTINGREFQVLWKPSAAYLRADGRMFELGVDLEAEEASRLARIEANTLLAVERFREQALIHRIYRRIQSRALREAAANYIKSSVELEGQSFPLVWAPFNHNIFVCLRAGWQFVDVAPSIERAQAAARVFLLHEEPGQRKPGRPARRQPKPFPWRKVRDWGFALLLVLAFGYVVSLKLEEDDRRRSWRVPNVERMAPISRPAPSASRP